MKQRIVNFLAEAFVWTLFAAYVEVTVTATVERLSLGDKYVLHDVPFISLQGHSSTWDFISGVLIAAGVRGVLILTDRLQQRERVFRSLWARSFVVMIAIFAFEYAGGLVFNVGLGWHLWDYSQYRWHNIPLNLGGQITIVYAPFYFLGGVFLRPVYRAVHAVAPYVGESALAFLHDPLAASPAPSPAS
jgi:hypothetical protein